MKKSKVVLFIILVTTNLLLLPNQIQEVLSIQIFLFTVIVLGDLFHKKISKNKHITPSYFLVINFLRIFICVLFLLPKILNYSMNENTYIYNFFIIYFIYLFSDIILKTKIKN
tara:strand:- start:125 stop:463 length:339 start_codon:yes stop_codon:yes gene_type:complete